MVLQNRLEYGFNGYQVPATPRASRSTRRRSSFKKKPEDNQMCAFDLLATVAGKLLLEKESSPMSSNMSSDKDQYAAVKHAVKKECQGEDKLVKAEACDQGSCDRRYFVSEPVSQAPINHSYRESPGPENDHCRFTSAVATSNCTERFDTQKLVKGKTKNEIGSFDNKVGVGPSGHGKAGDCNKTDGDAKKIVKDKLHGNEKALFGIGTDSCSLRDPVVRAGKLSGLVSLDSSVQEREEHVPRSSFPGSWDDVNFVSKDDDESSSGCTHPSITKKLFRPTPRLGDRRIRKVLASKYWKVAPKLKDVTFSNTNVDFKPAYWNRKNSYKRLRSDRNYPFKKRKFFDCISVSNSDEGISSECVSDAPEKGIIGDDFGSHPKTHEASSSARGQHPSFQSRDSHVKLRIKSFRVPELFIELPETATVGSLKRTVMEAVTAILGGELRVGVFLQGKKVRDDNKTLLQTGISQDNQSDSLGFCLEPNPSQASKPLCPEESPFLLPCGVPQPLSRYPPAPGMIQQDTRNVMPEPRVANTGNSIDSDHDSAPSPTDMSVDKSTTDSRALVAVPSVNVETLAVVPVHRKSKRSEVVQRRIRRPFSVAEVEALVQAVEKLGTGRWRDVKLRAFDNAKHRTYVDLKDKWKTLVHTARISPQQRRGEPVPQELLDRVLTAHAYWSQQQAKQQLKQQQQSENCLLL
ncbi:telomere repeat-binding protein 5 isoform X1 [Carica papaya]|uniref:telomere repeat-binding protein 5 isoform X1 n=1 Tax=Carica papaya TaxID=3649 RepID=UPI000B8C8A1D|nr:telomere repeat-binding protein 5 isoform X1 [Carica papaya]XP_021894510.1 telomere repeat-binding protein 5 isoform X1 [Carica papaya]